MYLIILFFGINNNKTLVLILIRISCYKKLWKLYILCFNVTAIIFVA